MRLLCRLSSVRLWLAVVLISAGFVCALWAAAPGGGPVVGPKRPTARDCEVAQSLCAARCKNKYGNLQDWLGPCLYQCGAQYADCTLAIQRASVGAGAVGQTEPPNKTGPNSTPTPTPPRKYPIKGPPHKLGPNPTPSPTPWTGFPKPTPPPIGSPTPTPSATPRRHPIKGPPHKSGPSPSPSAKPILLAKPKPTPSPKPTPKKSSHSHY